MDQPMITDTTHATDTIRIWAYQDGQGRGYFYRIKERDCCVPYIREDLALSREAALHEKIGDLRGEVERLRKAGDNLANAIEHGIDLSDAVTSWDNICTNLDDNTDKRETGDE